MASHAEPVLSPGLSACAAAHPPLIAPACPALPAAGEVVTFTRLDPAAILPMPADRSALGGIPAAAHQYCEALRSASGFGWYIFPAADIALRWDGAEVLTLVGEEWQPLTSLVSADFAEHWDQHCPEDLADRPIPYLSSLFVPGVVQIWSGLLVSTAPGWSVHIRPLANVPHSQAYASYEGIVEADWFKPLPLFINIRLLATERPIVIAKNRPLFVVQPLRRECYGDAGSQMKVVPDVAELGDAFDWAGLRSTIRSVSSERPHDFGRYGAEVRKRAKSGT
jgi:hypothetical protein